MWAALAVGIIGLVIFVQYPAGGVPFLLLAAVLAWRARARIAHTLSGMTQKFERPSGPALQAPHIDLGPITPLRGIRLVLAGLTLTAAFLSLWLLTDVLSAMARYSRFNWDYSGVGLLIGAGLGWAAWSVWAFRQALSATDMLRQLIDGALRLVVGGIGALVGIWNLSWLPQTVADDWQIASKVVACFALPGLVFLAAAGMGFANRERLVKLMSDRPVLRMALWVSATGGALSAALVFAAVYVHLTGRSHSLSVTALVWGVGCIMVAAAALWNGRSAQVSARRFGAGYGGAFVMALGGLIPALWAESFMSGRSLIENWNVLIVFMPFVLIGSLAISLLVIVLGWRIYRKAF